MLTKKDCVNSQIRQKFAHVSQKYKVRGKDSAYPRLCRVNGKCKTWKTRPDDFQLPVKYGFKTCFYITQDNARDWKLINH